MVQKVLQSAKIGAQGGNSMSLTDPRVTAS
jgi:hypothetical protein